MKDHGQEPSTHLVAFGLVEKIEDPIGRGDLFGVYYLATGVLPSEGVLHEGIPPTGLEEAGPPLAGQTHPSLTDHVDQVFHKGGTIRQGDGSGIIPDRHILLAP